MTGLLALLSSVIWWVLYSSVGAIVPALIVWVVLRWSERVPVVFNRAYLACLIWCMSPWTTGSGPGQSTTRTTFFLVISDCRSMAVFLITVQRGRISSLICS